jgi:phenylpropionate dioxygenase-like ring-hydroxylating dioxygenase large terminal subunit
VLVSEVPAFRDYWYPVAYSSEIGPHPHRVRILGDDYVLWRNVEGALGAAVDECPHRGSRLSQGWVERGDLVCPYHGWAFDVSGACTRIPQNDDDKPIPPRARTLAMLVEERYGLVWLCPGMPRESVPVLPECEDAGYTVIHELMEVWAASAPRVVDNALDVSHLSFVHRNSIGDIENPKLHGLAVQRTGSGLTMEVSYRSRVTAQQKANTGITADYTTRTTYAELVQPFVFRGVLEYENGLRHVLFKTCTPVDDTHTLFCQFVARNDAPDETKQAGIIAVDRQVQKEDRELLEGVRPEFPLSLQTEMHVRSDQMTVEYRRILAELAAESSAVAPDSSWARPFLSAVRDRSARTRP